jgi:phosphatidylserine decarboxylase
MEFLRWIPKNHLSRCVGGLVEVETPAPLAKWARDWFIKRYKINMDEAELPLESYPSISKLFVRRLKPGARPISAQAPVVHPCDAVLTTVETITKDTLIQAKGRHYSLKAMLACSESEAAPFLGGNHLVYYLCPTDYHRVHSPVDGEIVKVTVLPGALWPVNAWSVSHIDSLFAVNERVVVWIRSKGQLLALVMVGATNVGKITLACDPDVVSNSSSREILERSYEAPLPIKKGDEIGVFNMGSTVVMAYPAGFVADGVMLATGPTRMGRPLW